MTAPAVHSVIAVATSIPPILARQDMGQSIDDDYQRLCIRSWIDAGFRILSINDRQEIAALASRYPEINFVSTDRNASAWTGRKNPYIADLLSALKGAPEPVVGIINSDLIFEASLAWKERLPSLVGHAIILGQRYDATSLLKGTFRRFWPGFDYFFFDKHTANALMETAMPFAMGLPFWDYWLPAAASANKRRVLVVNRPGAVHLIHEHGYKDAALREFALIFASFIIREFERASHPVSECLSAIMPICRQIVSLREHADNREIFQKITDIMMLFLPRIREHIIDLESEVSLAPNFHLKKRNESLNASASRDESLNIANIFRRFDQRFDAGEAFERAKGLQQQGKWADAERDFQAAMQGAPEDFDVLLSFGEFLFSRGAKERACQILTKAVEQQPNSPRPINSLGVVLYSMRKHDEAIECFKKVLRIDPKFKDAYMNLAVVLFEARRLREALQCVERALAEWPHFPEAAELHFNISRAVQA
jgi:TolA-binding protein